MGMEKLTTAIRMISEHPELSEFVGPRPAAWIAAAERCLNVRFPPTYRTFLLELGAGAFGSVEFFGVVDDNWEDSGLPDVVWLAMRAQREGWLPQGIVPIYDDGMGNWLVLNLREPWSSGEPNVVAWEMGRSQPDANLEIIAPNFGAFLLDEVNDVLSRRDSSE
jgi:hypothetical protein